MSGSLPDSKRRRREQEAAQDGPARTPFTRIDTTFLSGVKQTDVIQTNKLMDGWTFQYNHRMSSHACALGR